jgi:hypothetical protein
MQDASRNESIDDEEEEEDKHTKGQTSQARDRKEA